MPYRPMKPCAYPGCPRLTSGRYCEEHAAEEARRNNRRRDPESNRRYGRTWKKVRAAFLAAHPLCETCVAQGRLTPATIVHHKVKLTDGGAKSKHFFHEKTPFRIAVKTAYHPQRRRER